MLHFKDYDSYSPWAELHEIEANHAVYTIEDNYINMMRFAYDAPEDINKNRYEAIIGINFSGWLSIRFRIRTVPSK